jgi:hypothetical protein
MGVPSRTRQAQSLAVLRHRLTVADRSVLTYWAITLILSVLFLPDWISSWNVSATWSKPWLIILLIVTWGFGQILYRAVAIHGGRPIQWGSAALFAIGNGIIETFAFALVYRFGEVAGSSLVGMFAPVNAHLAGFIGGVLFFIIYGGLIHALFWLKILPRHLNDTPRARLIRKWRPVAEIGLVLGWSLCFWLTRDIWTVVFFHILVDFMLMILVRPPMFTAWREARIR